MHKVKCLNTRETETIVGVCVFVDFVYIERWEACRYTLSTQHMESENKNGFYVFFCFFVISFLHNTTFGIRLRAHCAPLIRPLYMYVPACLPIFRSKSIEIHNSVCVRARMPSIEIIHDFVIRKHFVNKILRTRKP